MDRAVDALKAADEDTRTTHETGTEKRP
jgi:hypothetical protein